jgi:hypothetical protein
MIINPFLMNLTHFINKNRGREVRIIRKKKEMILKLN